MLKKYSLKALQTAINQAMCLDENMPSKISALKPGVVEIIISPLNTHFFIQFKEGKMLLVEEYTTLPDTVIHSSPLGFIRLSVLPASKARSLFNDKIRITGDVELGQQIKELFDNLDIDWEGHLANFTGDIVAYKLGSLVRQGLNFKKQFSQSMSQNITEYLQEELKVLPSHQEAQDFYNEVDTLSLRIERLQAQINLLMSHHEIH